MIVYKSDTDTFVERVRDNTITDIMQQTFEGFFGRRPGTSEVGSWQNSLSRVRDLIELAGLKDNMIALEYEVPYNQNRIDCLIFGVGDDSAHNVVLIELKQWSRVTPLEDEGNFVETYTGGSERVVPHPSQQVKGYHHYLTGFISAFEEPKPLILFSCAYCHNYERQDNDGIFAPFYREIISEFPVYAKSDVRSLAEKIRGLLAAGNGFEIFNRFMRSPVRPSKKLLDNVARVVKNEAVFSLLNEQITAKNLIWARVRRAKTKSVVIVHGGPGTGKSVIAVNLLAEAAAQGKKVLYGCKSKPFTEGLKALVGSDASLLFSNLYRFIPSRTKENEFDLLLIDEAHRIEKTSNFQYTKRVDQTDMPQVEQLIRCAKTSVFFIDDKQNVRSREIGSSALIQEVAKAHKCAVSEVALETQYRCMGSNDYLQWVESVLGFSEQRRMLSESDVFDFRIMDSPSALYDVLKEKEGQKANSARLVAGYCWPWSKTLDDSGALIKDVRIGDFAMPWETHDAIKRPPAGYVKWYEWAYKTQGIKQVGCIYTAQGFEFDYIGVIIGDDLRYDNATDNLKANIEASADPTLKSNPKAFASHVRNIYRVLLTRGMRGCYVYFVNDDTRRFFESRIQRGKPEIIPFQNSLPLLNLRAVANASYESLDGLFAEESVSWLPVKGGPFPKDRFLVRAEGDSMEPRIKDGDLCLFRRDPGGSRNGKIVLCRIEGFAGAAPLALIKQYRSARARAEEGAGEAKAVVLSSLNAKYEDIVFSEGDNLSILGIFEKTIET